MPRLSDSMDGGDSRALAESSRAITSRRGEPLVEIETDKATITYESDVDGVLTHFTVGEGQTVAVGTPIADRRAAGRAAGSAASRNSRRRRHRLPPLPIPTAGPASRHRRLPELRRRCRLRSADPPHRCRRRMRASLQPHRATGRTAEQPPRRVRSLRRLRPTSSRHLPAHHDVTEEFPVDDQFAPDRRARRGRRHRTTSTPRRRTTSRRPAELPIASRLHRSPAVWRSKLGVEHRHDLGQRPRRSRREGRRRGRRRRSRAAQAAPSTPTQAPAPIQPEPQYAYEPGGSEQHEEDSRREHRRDHAAALPPEEEQILPPPPRSPPSSRRTAASRAAADQQPPIPTSPPPQEPSLIPNFPPPPLRCRQQPLPAAAGLWPAAGLPAAQQPIRSSRSSPSRARRRSCRA